MDRRNSAPGAVLTAAGLSSRMGAFKPLLPVAGVPLLETGIRALRAGGVERIYVVTGHRAADLRPLLARTGAVEVHNPDYARTDMFASVRLGLSRGAEDCGRLFFLPGDVALFRPHSVRAMAARPAGLVLPRYRDRLGHPVLLGQDCVAHVLAHDGAGGLRGALDAFPGPREVLDLPDPGLLSDADTPADYAALLDYAAHRETPDRAACLEILRWYGTPPETAAHCAAVADTALALCAALNNRGGWLDPRLVETAALLHDLAKGAPRHDEAGAAVLRELDCPAAAQIVACHMSLPAGAEEALDERAVVYYADKITQGVRRIPLAERAALAQSRFQGDPAALEAANLRTRAALRVEARLRAVLSAPPRSPGSGLEAVLDAASLPK